MSCINSVDLHNNIPIKKDGNSGSNQGMPPRNMNEQYGGGPTPPQQWGNQRSNAMAGRPAQTPGYSNQLPQGPPQQWGPPQQGGAPGGRLDPQTEIFMLRSDLNEAIQYIHKLGGTWPPS